MGSQSYTLAFVPGGSSARWHSSAASASGTLAQSCTREEAAGTREEATSRLAPSCKLVAGCKLMVGCIGVFKRLIEVFDSTGEARRRLASGVLPACCILSPHRHRQHPSSRNLPPDRLSGVTGSESATLMT